MPNCNKTIKNFQSNINYQDDEFYQNQYYNKSKNSNNQYKNFPNKKNIQKNFDLNYQERNIKDNKSVEVPLYYNQVIYESAEANDYVSKENSVNAEKNTQVRTQSDEINLKNDKNTKLNSANKQEEKIKDYISVDNSIQVDSYNSVEENNTLKNAYPGNFNEKNFIEDNTKTNTNSNSSVNVSPIIPYNKKSINSIKNENKLDDSREYNGKTYDYKDVILNQAQETKQELNYMTNDKNKHIINETSKNFFFNYQTSNYKFLFL